MHHRATFSRDGIQQNNPAAGRIRLLPGESVPLPPSNYHVFWGEKGRDKCWSGGLVQ
ncbi:MAG: D-lyxose/D-mannose family sugar isomerase [Candidatus Brocadiia bacterium]